MGRGELAWVWMVLLGAAPAAASEALRLDDPRYDDHGPGSYIYPTGPWYRRGMYDLRAFEVVPGESEVTFRIWLDFPVEKPEGLFINTGQLLQLNNEIYFQNIDIFVDHTPGVGHTDGIPGRNVRFRPQEAWDFALVITPQPDLVRQILRGWPPARQILVADSVRSRGTEIWVSVPYATIGGRPDKDSGYQVVVSGALERNNFEVFERVTDAFQVDALTIPVFGVAETQAFGGGDLSRWQPRSIDILTPSGITQKEILSYYDHDTRDFAILPMVYPSGRKPVATVAPIFTSTTAAASSTPRPNEATLAAPSVSVESTVGTEGSGGAGPADDGFTYTTVREVHEQMAILEARPGLVDAYRIGTVVGPQGEELGRVVVTAVYPDFIQATIVQGQDRVARGARVRFDPKKE